jgi:bacterioferritin-associated ferredoxin
MDRSLIGSLIGINLSCQTVSSDHVCVAIRSGAPAPLVTLSAAKGLARWVARCFAALSMTVVLSLTAALRLRSMPGTADSSAPMAFPLSIPICIQKCCGRSISECKEIQIKKVNER